MKKLLYKLGLIKPMLNTYHHFYCYENNPQELSRRISNFLNDHKENCDYLEVVNIQHDVISPTTENKREFRVFLTIKTIDLP